MSALPLKADIIIDNFEAISNVTFTDPGGYSVPFAYSAHHLLSGVSCAPFCGGASMRTPCRSSALRITEPGIARLSLTARVAIGTALPEICLFRHRGVLTVARIALSHKLPSYRLGPRAIIHCDHGAWSTMDEDQGEGPSRGPRGSSASLDGGGNLRADPPSQLAADQRGEGCARQLL